MHGIILASLVRLSDQRTTADTRSPQIPTPQKQAARRPEVCFCVFFLHLSFGIATQSPSLSTDGPLHEYLQGCPFPGPGG